MLCKKCGNEIKEGVAFCPKCGEKNTKEEIEIKEPSSEEALENEASKKKKNKIVVVVLMGILLLVVGGFWLKASANIPKNNYLLYIRDNEIYFLDVADKKGKPQLITEKLFSGGYVNWQEERFRLKDNIYFTSDGKIIVYPDKNDINQVGFNLFFKKLKDDKSEAKKIDSEITKYFVVDASSKSKIFYVKGKESNFYKNDMEENRVKIATNVANFWVNKSGNDIVFITKDGDIYLVDATGDKEKIATTSKIVDVKNDLTKIYYIKDKTLYCKTRGKDRERIAKDVSYVFKIYDTGEIYFSLGYEVKTKMIDFIDDNLSVTDANIQKPYAPKQPVPPEFSSWQDYNRAVDAYRIAYSSYDDARRKYYEKEMRDNLRKKLSEEDFVEYKKTLCYYDGKKISNVAEDFQGQENFGKTAVCIYTKIGLKDNKKLQMSDIPVFSTIKDIKHKIWWNETMAPFHNKVVPTFVAIKDKSFELKVNMTSSFRINDSSTKIYFLDDYNRDDYNRNDAKGDLYEVNIENGGLGKQVKVDSEVRDLFYLSKGKNTSVRYFKNYKDHKFVLYMDKVFIDSDVSVEMGGVDEWIGDGKKLVYSTDWNPNKKVGVLKIYDGEKSKIISSETNQFDVLSDSRILYLDKFDKTIGKGDLYLYNGTDEKKQIDTDVSAILHLR